MKEEAVSIIKTVRDGDGAVEEEFPGDDGISVKAGLAYMGVDLLEILEALTVRQQRTAELLSMVHYQDPIQPSKLPPCLKFHVLREVWKFDFRPLISIFFHEILLRFI